MSFLFLSSASSTSIGELVKLGRDSQVDFMDKVEVLFDECLPLRAPNQNREILDDAVDSELFGMVPVVTEKTG